MMDRVVKALERAADYASDYMEDDDPEMLMVGLDILVKVSQVHKNLQYTPEPTDPVSEAVRELPKSERVKLAKQGATGGV